jgi:hypothetical protein
MGRGKALSEAAFVDYSAGDKPARTEAGSRHSRKVQVVKSANRPGLPVTTLQGELSADSDRLPDPMLRLKARLGYALAGACRVLIKPGVAFIGAVNPNPTPNFPAESLSLRRPASRSTAAQGLGPPMSLVVHRLLG